jgi:eukaryotic-like serine/threonine-protein kinase
MRSRSIAPQEHGMAIRSRVGYFLLTGKKVFEANTPVEVCIAHVTKAPTPPSQLRTVEPGLEAILMKCLAKQPADRYATARDLRETFRVGA